jgi:hypothetical protein
LKRFQKVRDINPDSLSKHAPYLAGLLDGEGTFSIRMIERDHLLFSLMVEISMSHKETIEFVAGIFGVTWGRRKMNKPHHKDMYYLRVTTHDEIRQIAKALLPYSITKHEQIQLVLDFFSLKDTFPGGQYDSHCTDILQKMIDVCIELLKRNERGKPPNYRAMREKLRAKLIQVKK